MTATDDPDNFANTERAMLSWMAQSDWSGLNIVLEHKCSKHRLPALGEIWTCVVYHSSLGLADHDLGAGLPRQGTLADIRQRMSRTGDQGEFPGDKAPWFDFAQCAPNEIVR